MPAKKKPEKTTIDSSERSETSVLDLLATIDRPLDFCVANDWQFVLPGLEVDGLGTVGLPLAKSAAAELIETCSQAPYGKGTKTLVDTKVRRVWELDPSRFQLTNPAWQSCVREILKEAQLALGLEKRKLTAHLYKLLLYEKGSFFLPHRDGEKIDGMVATLVIGLPSQHSGGELVVSHDNQTRAISFSAAAAGHGLSYALFYADCEHEVRKLKSGFRLCLTYNVTLAKSKSKQTVTAPTYGNTIRQVANHLTSRVASDEAWKSAFTLDHAYTKDGLCVELLKGTDRAKADVLFAAAESAGCEAHLAVVTHWKSGSAESSYEPSYSRYGRTRRYRRDYDESEDDEEKSESSDVSDYVMGEVYDESTTLSCWSDRNGKKVLLGAMPLDEAEIVSADAIDQWQANREEFEGYTGNAGMTLERWYHRAAIVIWPATHHFRLLCDAGTNVAIAGLSAMVKALKRTAKVDRELKHRDCIAFASAIIDAWNPNRGDIWSSSHEKVEVVDRNLFAVAIAELDDFNLIQRYIAQVLPNDNTVGLNPALIQRCRQHGWKALRSLLEDVVQHVTAKTLERNLSLVQELCSGSSVTKAELTFASDLLSVFVESIIAFDLGRKSSAVSWDESIDRSKVLTTLIEIAIVIGKDKALKRFIAHALATCKHYDLTDVHLKTIFALEKTLQSISAKSTTKTIGGWLKSCKSELECRTSLAPQPPADLRRAGTMDCNCADCKQVAAFLKDPDIKQLRLPLAKQRRQHLHNRIDSRQLDLAHVTDRRGSPQTLVLTKTIATFEAAQKIHVLNLKNLTRLDKLIQKIK